MKEEKEFYSIGRGSLNLNGKFYYGLDYAITDFMRSLEEENKSLQSQLKAKEEVIKKFEKYLNDCVSELENNYGTSSIQNAINTGIVDITKVILSKFNEILSKGENK